MCGIAGFISRGTSVSFLQEVGKLMGDALVHRGPDAGGGWCDEAGAVVLSHRRLAIQDLSEAGAQPMISSDQRYVMVYNGEVYNADEIKAKLLALGKTFRGHSDTEIVIEGIAQWGLDALIEQLNGIFAIALWDRAERRLYLARDRLGIKPLFYGRVAGGIAFGSELKALHAIPGAKFNIDENAVAAFTMLGYVPAPRSIYKEIEKLTPGVIALIDEGLIVTKRAYVSLDQVVSRARANPFRGTEQEAVEQLDEIMRRVVKRQLLADVPVGAFLSGGVDSSAVAAAIGAVGRTNLSTFTIKYSEAAYDESPYARSVANALNTQHEELLVSPSDAISIVPKLPELTDEPFADASIIPTYLVCQAARSRVGVALSGDGGDELFSGYRRYMYAPMIFERSRLIPAPLRRMIAGSILAVSANAWDQFFQRLPGHMHAAIGGLKLYKMANILLAKDPEEVFFRQLAAFSESPMAAGKPTFPGFSFPADPDLELSFADRMQLIDQHTYLTDNNLAKVDRASMGLSLEVRVPLLDNEVVDFAWSLPERYKRQGRSGKVVLKRVLERYVHRNLVDRPKMGFGLPVDMWLRGPLRDWAECMLDRRRLAEDGWFDAGLIHRYWQEHLTGRFNRAQALWHVLMFQAWKERWV